MESIRAPRGSGCSASSAANGTATKSGLSPRRRQVGGEERVRVPAGTFDCWKVDTKLRRTEATLWIAKSGQWVVKLAQHMGSDAVWEQVLTAYTVTPPAP